MKRIINIYAVVLIALLLSSCTVVVEDEESYIESKDIQNHYDVSSNNVVVKYCNDAKNNDYEIMLVQTDELPLSPEDDDFDIYKSAYYGEFELWLIKDESIVDLLNLNDLFGVENIGFIGKFDLVRDDLNNDGKMDFNIGIRNENSFNYIVFTVKENSFKVFTFDGSKILKSASTHHSEEFERGAEGEIVITLPKNVGGFYEKRYYWKGDEFKSN